MDNIDKIGLKTELKFRTSRSSGPGGQSVNKVSTKVSLLFNLWDSQFLDLDEKEIIFNKLSNRINNLGVLSLSSEETRSQLGNKELVIERFFILLEDALKPIKKRTATKRTKSSKEKRLKTKKIKSDKKELRKPPEI